MNDNQRKAMWSHLAKKKVFPFDRKREDYEFKQAIIVPSTNKQQKFIGKKRFDERIKQTENKLISLFGGTTTIEAKGMWGDTINHKKVIVGEKVARVVNFADEDKKRKFESGLKKLGVWIKQKKRSWGQRSMGYEHEDDLLFV